LIDPIVSKSGQKVGVIKVFEDVTDEQKVLHQSAIFNVVVTAILWSITVALAAAYLRRARVAEISCAQIPFLEESDTVEFKSSLRCRWHHSLAAERAGHLLRGGLSPGTYPHI
jgi:hypothetical protein